MLATLSAFANMIIRFCKAGETIAMAAESGAKTLHNLAQVGEQMSQGFLEEETSKRLVSAKTLTLE